MVIAHPSQIPIFKFVDPEKVDNNYIHDLWISCKYKIQQIIIQYDFHGNKEYFEKKIHKNEYALVELFNWIPPTTVYELPVTLSLTA